MAPVAPPSVDYGCNYEKIFRLLVILECQNINFSLSLNLLCIFILLAGGSVLGGCVFSTSIVGFVVSRSGIVVFCIVGLGVVCAGIE